jgi:hypothetical protein
MKWIATPLREDSLLTGSQNLAISQAVSQSLAGRADCVATYVQRDVRQILNVGDLGRFTTFLRLCAAHTAQELKLSALRADAGISHNTANAWLSVLESSVCAVGCRHGIAISTSRS